MNIGRKPGGTIPEREQQMLCEIDRWLDVNGQAIYGSRPWTQYGEGPTVTDPGHLSENKNQAFTASDIHFTTKGGILYAMAVDWLQDNALVVNSLGNGAGATTTGVTLPGSESPIVWKQTEAGLHVRLPQQQPCEHAFLLRIEH